MLSIRPEDDGTFFCAAQNPAGVARANFTVRLVDNILDSISSGSETAVSTSSGTSGTSGLQENTDQLNLESAEIPDEDMFKVYNFRCYEVNRGGQQKFSVSWRGELKIAIFFC